jgi:hypothetical protein
MSASEPATSEAQLLELLGGDPERAREMLRTMLAERAAEDPRFALLGRLLERADDEAPDRADRVQRMHARIGRMRADLGELYERNDVLAAALGACPACWGQVATCAECRGHGMPGWLRPDPALYEEFVAPAVARQRREVPGQTKNGEDSELSE